MNFVVIKDQTSTLFKQVLNTRYIVLRKPLGMHPTYPHPLDTQDSWHVIALEQSTRRVIGTVSFDPHSSRLYQMAVETDYQGKGIGASLVRKLIQEVRVSNPNITEISLHARHYAVGFYAKFGFIEHGQHFQEIGMDHVQMNLKL